MAKEVKQRNYSNETENEDYVYPAESDNTNIIEVDEQKYEIKKEIVPDQMLVETGWIRSRGD